MKKLIPFITLLLLQSLLTGCASDKKTEDSSAVKMVTDTLINRPDSLPHAGIAEITAKNVTPEETTLKDFLLSPEGTKGWETKDGKVTFDFLKDGKLMIHTFAKKDTTREGTWKLKDGQLTLFRPDLKTAQTDTVKMEGDKLIWGRKVYTRYKPS